MRYDDTRMRRLNMPAAPARALSACGGDRD